MMRPSPRAAKTRGALLSAGLDLLADRPVDAISIDELVAAAGVGKGSFFNHYSDKPGFADAVAADIRGVVEDRVARANAGLADPVERLSGGLIVAAAFALSEPKRTAVLIRAVRGMTLADHPLNRGVLEDLRACAEAGAIRPEARRAGVLFWLGCCQAVMNSILDERATVQRAEDLLGDMLALGLRGLGVDNARAAALAAPGTVAAKLRQAMAD